MKKREERYLGLLNNLEAGVVVHAADTSIIESNPKASELLGLTIDQMLGKKAIDPSWKFLATDNSQLPFESYPVNLIKTTKLPLKNLVVGVNRPSTNDVVWVIVNGFPVIKENGDLSEILISFIDITQSRKTEAILFKSEQRYQRLAKVAPVGIFHTDENGDTAYVNPRWCQITGLSSEEALGHNWLSAVHEDDKKNIIKEWKSAVSMQEISASEFRFVRPDGTIAWVMGQAIPEKNDNGKVVGYVGTITDITERKKSEEEKSRLLNTIQKSLDEIYMFNTENFQFQYANDGALKNLGYTAAEIYKLTPLDIKPEMTIEKVKKLISPLLNNQKEKIVFETTHKRKDKSTYPVEVHLQLIDDGEKKVFLTITRDISERKRAEEVLKEGERYLKETQLIANLGTYTLDIVTGNWTGSKVLDQILGIDENFEKTYEGGQAILHPEWRQVVANYFTEEVISKKNKFDFEYKIIRPNDKKERWVHCVGDIILDNNSQPITLLATVRDITHTKQMEEALRDSNNFLVETQLLANLGTYTMDITTGKWTSSEILDRIFGIDDHFDKTYENWPNMIHPDWRKLMTDYFVEDVIGKKRKFDKEYKIVRINDRAERWIHGVGSLKYNAKNEPITMVGTIRDITESKEAQEQIREKSVQLEKLSDNLPGTVMYQVITDLNRKSKFSYLSNSVERLTGKTVDEIMLNPISLYYMVVDDDRQKIMEIGASAILSVNEIDCEVRYQNHLKELRWMHIRAVPRKTDEGTIVWDGVNTDITKQKEAEEELKFSEEKYRQIVETAQEGIFVIDENNLTSFVNQRMADMLGYEREEMIGKTLFYFMDEAGIKKTEKYIERRKQGISEEFEFRFKKKNGDDLYSLIMTNPIISGNVYKGALAMIMDITNKKLVEREIMLLMNNTDENFFSVDKQLKIVSFNEQFKINNLKYVGKEVKKGDSILDYVSPSRTNIVTRIFRNVFKGERSEIEMQIPMPDKTKVTFLNRYKPNYNNEGKIIGAFVTSIDITDRKMAEEEVVKSKDELRNLSSHLENMREVEGARIAREIHDELGQQLTSIKMDASWISKKAGISDKAVTDKIDDMLHLIDETVKTVRRIASKLRPGILDDLGLIATLEWQCNEFAKRSEIKCNFKSKLNDFNIDKNTATSIFRVCQEALNNIARYAKATEVKVNIQQIKNVIRLTIQDNGIGFNIEEIKIKNTLGIIGMKERAFMLGGTLVIESEVEKGTKLILKVPMKTELAS